MRSDHRLLPVPTSCRRVSVYNLNFDPFSGIRSDSHHRYPLFRDPCNTPIARTIWVIRTWLHPTSSQLSWAFSLPVSTSRSIRRDLGYVRYLDWTKDLTARTDDSYVTPDDLFPFSHPRSVIQFPDLLGTVRFLAYCRIKWHVPQVC